MFSNATHLLVDEPYHAILKMARKFTLPFNYTVVFFLLNLYSNNF